MLKQFSIQTSISIEFLDITKEVLRIVKESTIKNGVCHIFVPHTTAAIMINENADPSVILDIKEQTDKIVPFIDNYKHLEGNSAAHIKASLFGPSETIFIENGNFVLGPWQGLFFCEFDGPRTRKVFVSIT